MCLNETSHGYSSNRIFIIEFLIFLFLVFHSYLKKNRIKTLEEKTDVILIYAEDARNFYEAEIIFNEVFSII